MLKNPLVTRAHFYTLLMGVCALCEADSPDSQMSGLFCVALLRTRECLPCAATAAIPAHFAAETVCWRSKSGQMRKARIEKFLFTKEVR